MTLKEFLDMYDNWNGLLTINDDELMKTVGDAALYSKWIIFRFVDAKENDSIMKAKVVAFGFYDGELCVRVRQIETEEEEDDGDWDFFHDYPYDPWDE